MACVANSGTVILGLLRRQLVAIQRGRHFEGADHPRSDQRTARPAHLPEHLQHTSDDADPCVYCTKFNPSVSHKKLISAYLRDNRAPLPCDRGVAAGHVSLVG